MKTSALALVAALGLVASPAFAQTTAPVVAPQATVSAPMTAAPVPQVNIAPPSSGHCGLFETCANTKIGLGKGDSLIRLSALGVLPQDTASRVKVIGGRVEATNQVAPEFTFECFFTDHISLDLIAAGTRLSLPLKTQLSARLIWVARGFCRRHLRWPATSARTSASTHMQVWV